MLRKIIRLSLFILLTTFLLSTTAKELSIEHFSRGAEYSNLKLSPNGQYLAGISETEGKRMLFIYDLSKNSFSHAVNFPESAQVGNYHWVNDERVVLEKQYIKGWNDHPSYHGELYGVNADGSNPRYLVGHKGQSQVGSRLKKATPIYGTSYVLDPLHHDEDYMLIVTYPWGTTSSKEPYTQVYRVDVNKGKRRKVTRAPTRLARYLTDHNGEVRLAVSSSDYINQKLFIRDLKEKTWQELTLNRNDLTNIGLHAFDETGEYVYASASIGGAPKGIYKLSLKTKELELIHKDNVVDPSNIWIDETNKELFAIEYEPGYPTYAFVDKKSKMTKRLKSMLKTFEGNQVQIVSSSRDADMSVVRTVSDINPGEYYLYDAKVNKLQYLFANRSWIDPDLMAQSKPISFEARDGLTIHGYLTLPEGKKAENLPLVVMPHGGPHGPRDWWGFDSDTQLLANKGMAVLKVNFRGSGGYGPAFEFKGHRQWGHKIQHDIIDGVKHIIEQGIANKDNVCIMGASFGGYSALQSAIIEPDMFKCAIGVVGVYDLAMMFEEGDVAERSSGQSYLTQVLGTNKEEIIRFSPNKNIASLKAPVLIVHGGEDRRAPLEQAEALIEALKKAKHPYEYELLENEGHGFYKPEHRTLYYKRVLAFLDQHLVL